MQSPGPVSRGFDDHGWAAAGEREWMPLEVNSWNLYVEPLRPRCTLRREDLDTVRNPAVRKVKVESDPLVGQYSDGSGARVPARCRSSPHEIGTIEEI